MGQNRREQNRPCPICNRLVRATARGLKLHISACADGPRSLAVPEQAATDRVDGVTPVIPEPSQRTSQVQPAAPCLSAA